MPLLKPFRALRYDVRAAGPLDRLVAPPYDVISGDELERFVAASRYNVIRLIRPHEPELAAERFRRWSASGILAREERLAVWRLEEEFVGPDGAPRTRHGLVARVRLEPYANGVILPHERTFPAVTAARLRLLRAVRAKLSPVLLLHEGASPGVRPEREPDLEASLGETRSRLWRIDDPAAIEAEIAAVRGRLIIADGHHRYESALRFHGEEGSVETAYVLSVLVSREDEGLEIFPTHRLVEGAVPELANGFRVTPLSGAAEGLERLARLGRDHPAFVLLRPGGTVLAELPDGGESPLERLDVAALEHLALGRVNFTASAGEAEAAVASGRARAAILVRAPTIEQVESVVRAGKTMPEKTTYFFPKLMSGLLISPFDE